MFVKIREFINKLRNKEDLPEPTGFIYRCDMHTTWGNAINLDAKEVEPGMYKWTAHGHLRRLPKNGDIFETKTSSGRIVQMLVCSVRYCSDPRDMWFCDLSFYKEIEEFSEPSKPPAPHMFRV